MKYCPHCGKPLEGTGAGEAYEHPRKTTWNKANVRVRGKVVKQKGKAVLLQFVPEGQTEMADVWVPVSQVVGHFTMGAESLVVSRWFFDRCTTKLEVFE